MPSSCLPPKPQITEAANTMGSELFFLLMLHVFKHKEGQNEAYLEEGFVESLRYVQVCTALCNDT